MPEALVRARDGGGPVALRIAGAATLAGVTDHEDGHLDEATRAWVQAEADQHFGGNFGAAAAAIIEAAYAAELAPGDPWAGLGVRMQRRVGRWSPLTAPGENP